MISPSIMFFRAALIVSSLSLCAVAQSTPAVLTSCGPTSSVINFKSLQISPTSPSAGDNVTLTATGVALSSVTGGVANIDAYLFGTDVFSSSVQTCGQNQSVDVMGIVTGTMNALACPLAPAAAAAMSFNIVIPSEGSGLGQLTIILNATQQTNLPAFCVNLTVTL